ncbi:hypothetical protein [Spirosoma lituiforme]
MKKKTPVDANVIRKKRLTDFVLGYFFVCRFVHVGGYYFLV